MAEAVLMPKTGITVESCIIEEWKKKVGDQVKLDEVLFTYETDKAVFDCPSTAEGELLEIYYQDGDEVPCLQTVCAVGKKGDDCSAIRPGGAEAAPAAAAQEQPEKAEQSAAQAAPRQTGSEDGALASPRAKRLAAQAGVDWHQASPTGCKGLIVERDIRGRDSRRRGPGKERGERSRGIRRGGLHGQQVQRDPQDHRALHEGVSQHLRAADA